MILKFSVNALKIEWKALLSLIVSKGGFFLFWKVRQIILLKFSPSWVGLPCKYVGHINIVSSFKKILRTSLFPIGKQSQANGHWEQDYTKHSVPFSWLLRLLITAIIFTEQWKEGKWSPANRLDTLVIYHWIQEMWLLLSLPTRQENKLKFTHVYKNHGLLYLVSKELIIIV